MHDDVFSREQLGRQLLYDLSTGRLKEAFELVSQGASLDMKDSFGARALSIAAFSGYTDMVETLIARNAEIDTKDENGFTPLMLAASKGCSGAVEKLLKAGASVEERNAAGETAADIAKSEGHLIIASAIADMQIAHRQQTQEEWKDVAVQVEHQVSVSKPIRLKL